MNQDDLNETSPTLQPFDILLLLLAVAGGACTAAIVLPAWLPGLTYSLLGDQPKVYWYLARSSGFAAFLAFWMSIAFGLIITNKMARLWNSGPLAVDLHQFTTWLAFALSLFHALILLGDRYIQSTPAQVLTPFGYIKYKPEWVAVGQIAFYLTFVVAVSFYFRKRIGYRTWRRLHYLSFVIYLMITLHGLFAGTDAAILSPVYLAFGVGTYFLTIYRIVQSIRVPAAHRPVLAPGARAGTVSPPAAASRLGGTAVGRGQPPIK
ncbi:MAG: ferric reductase-like transmembrane domain-containing protein [Rudaea sp.]